VFPPLSNGVFELGVYLIALLLLCIVEMTLAYQLYRFLARRTGSAFNETVLRRLYQSRTNRPPMSLSKIIDYSKEGQVTAVVGTVTDDVRLHEVPKGIRVCALRFTEGARARIAAVSLVVSSRESCMAIRAIVLSFVPHTTLCRPALSFCPGHFA
jgi:ribosomal protein L18E